MQGSSLMLWSSKRGRAKRLLRCHAWSWDLQRHPAPLPQRQANTCLANQLLSCFRGGDQLAEGLQGSIWQTCEGEAELEGLVAAAQGAKVTPRGPTFTHQAKTGWCCCTAAVGPRGPPWGRRQRLEAHWLEGPAGSPLLSAGPASQGCRQLYSPHSAERCTWSCAAHCGCAARTSPPKRKVSD